MASYLMAAVRRAGRYFSGRKEPEQDTATEERIRRRQHLREIHDEEGRLLEYASTARSAQYDLQYNWKRKLRLP